MREIKFRAWDGESGMSRPFDIWEAGEMRKGLILRQIINEAPVLMQYTGLKDKNGVEIYHLDIITTPSDSMSNATVIWSNENACFKLEFYNYVSGKRTKKRINMFSNIIKECEVVGNIYESRLLENK